MSVSAKPTYVQLGPIRMKRRMLIAVYEESDTRAEVYFGNEGSVQCIFLNERDNVRDFLTDYYDYQERGVL